MKRCCVLLAGLLGLVIGTASAASPPDIAGMTQREIFLLQFYGGGSPLSPQERQEAADIIENGMQHEPQAELAAAANAAKLVRLLAHAPGPMIARVRETVRLNVELHEAVSPALQQQQLEEARIIAAHDPVVVFDRAHKRLVTVQTLKILEQGNRLGAQIFSVPAPGEDFVAEMRQAIPRAWPSMDDGMQEAMAHAERDMPYAMGFLQSANRQKLADFVRTWRAKIMAAPDATGQQLNLAEVMAVIGMTGYRHAQRGGGGGGGQVGAALAERLQMQDLTQRQMLGAVRSFSPTCNVTSPNAGYNFTYCHP